MKLDQLDTPSLIIDRERLLINLADMQRYADSYGVQLRPHTKTHKMPAIAKPVSYTHLTLPTTERV